MLSWFATSEVIDGSGRVWSWLSTDHTGYLYPEAAALVLRVLDSEGNDDHRPVRERIARALVDDVSPAGGLGKGGRYYAFDSAMALAALLEPERRQWSHQEGVLYRLATFVRESLEKGVAAEHHRPTAHWSLSFGCHLLKACIALERFGALMEVPEWRCIARAFASGFLSLFDGERFRNNDAVDATYSHAHAYALEGIAVLSSMGWEGVDDVLENGVDWLVKIQDESGGVPAGFDVRPTKELHTDVTAQAVRLWCVVSPDRYSDSIDAGLGFLADMQADDGGLRYRPGSSDITSWATAFALQATRWAARRSSVPVSELV